MTDSSLATTTSLSLLTRGKEGKPSSYAAVLKNVPSSVSVSTRKKLDIFSSDVHPAPLRSKKKHEKNPDSLKKKPDSLVQIEPKAVGGGVGGGGGGVGGSGGDRFYPKAAGGGGVGGGVGGDRFYPSNHAELSGNNGNNGNNNGLRLEGMSQLSYRDASAASDVPKRKKSAVQSYALNRSACKILGDQPKKKRKK